MNDTSPQDESRPDPALVELLTALVDGELTDADRQRLETLLTEDAAARRFYVRYLTLHARLSLKYPRSPQEGSAIGMLPESLSANLPMPASTRPTHRSPSGPAPPRGGWVREMADLVLHPIMLVLLVACISGGVIAYSFWSSPQVGPPELARTKQHESPPIASPPSEPPAVKAPASITRSLEARWNEAMAPREGVLAVGQRLKLSSGLAEITFDQGATMIVEGPSDFVIDGPNACALRLGKLTARVPVAARGFLVHTPTLDAIDLGTEFGVMVNAVAPPVVPQSPDRDTLPPAASGLQPLVSVEVSVFEGEVAIQHPNAKVPKPVVLVAGQGIVSEGAAAPRIIEAKGKSFVRSLPPQPKPPLAATLPVDSPLKPGDILAVSRKLLKLVKIDPKTGKQSELARGDHGIHGTDWMCVAVDAQRQIFVGTEVSGGGGQLLRIDPRDGSIVVVAGGELLKAGRINGLTVATDGSLLATQDGTKDSILSIDPKSGAAAQVADFGDNVWGIAADGNGRDAIVVSDGAQVAVARLHGKTLTPWVFYEDPRTYRGVAVRPDGRVFVSYFHHDKRKIAEIDRRTHRVTEVAVLPQPNASLGTMAVEADGNLIVGSYDSRGEVFRIDVENKTARLIAEGGHLEGSGGVAVVPNR